MRKIYLILVVLPMFCTALYGQNHSELKDAIDNLQQSIQEVTTKSSTYEQSIIWDIENPHKLKLIQDKIGKKKTIHMSYEFSLQDIDKNTVRVKEKKDLMTISIFMNNSQKFIKVFKDDLQQKYTNKITIMASDIDNGRAIKTALLNAIKLSKTIKTTCNPETFSQRIKWLTENINDFNINDISYEQAFTQADEKLPIVTYSFAKRGKKTKEELWKFNMADLNSRKIKMNVKEKDIFIEIQTKRNLKYIFYEKDGKQGSYTNKVKIYVDDFDRAKCLLDIFKKSLKQSEEMVKDKYSNPSSLKQALSLLEGSIKDVNTDIYELSQSIEPSCVTKLTSNKNKLKGDNIEEEYHFNFSDILPNSIVVNVKSKEVSLELSTGKTKLIQPLKDEEYENYTSKVSINADGIENAKMLEYALPKVIEFCKDAITFKASTNLNTNLTWVSEQLAVINESIATEQSMILKDDDQCKWQFTTIKKGKKQDKEEVFEFNLNDLDSKSIKFKITGKILSIQINTVHHEKVIKYYKNGEPGDYKPSFLIQMLNIEKAKNMIKVMNESINSCSQK